VRDRARLGWTKAIGSAVALVLAAGLTVSTVPASAAVNLEGVPRFKHIFTIVLENENFDASWGPGSPAHYLNSLRSQGAFATNYYGTSHVSAGNYMAMTSGQPGTPLFDSDCLNWLLCKTFERLWPDGGRNIADQVQEHGLTWKAYMDAMVRPCQHPAITDLTDPYQTGYATRHDPFVYYPDIVNKPTRCNSHVVNYTQLATDLASATTPNYIFITPDTCHDGHDAPCNPPEAGQPGGLVSADAWLHTEVPKIMASPAFNDHGLLLITFDENGFSDVQHCCLADGAFGGRVGLLALGPDVHAGRVATGNWDHWSYLRTVEDALGISEHLNFAGLPTVHPMTALLTP